MITLIIMWISFGVSCIVVMKSCDEAKIELESTGPYWMFEREIFLDCLIPVFMGPICIPFTLAAAIEYCALRKKLESAV